MDTLREESKLLDVVGFILRIVVLVGFPLGLIYIFVRDYYKEL